MAALCRLDRKGLRFASRQVSSLRPPLRQCGMAPARLGCSGDWDPGTPQGRRGRSARRRNALARWNGWTSSLFPVSSSPRLCIQGCRFDAVGMVAVAAGHPFAGNFGTRRIVVPRQLIAGVACVSSTPRRALFGETRRDRPFVISEQRNRLQE